MAKSLDELSHNFSQKEDFINRQIRTGTDPLFFSAKTIHQKQRVYHTLGFETKLVQQPIRSMVLSETALSLLGFGVETWREMRDLADKNRALFRQIRDENLWFVAENGDQYDVDNNPGLEEHGIRSLTFYPNSERVGWRVDIVSELIDENENRITLSYFINREGQFLTDFNIPLDMPLWKLLPFERFVLERLHFITSGVLGDKDHHGLGPGVEIRVDVGRRHHWRTLTSTPDRIYTLTSYSAKTHADFVLEKYGIDIYEENLRRRSVGTLGENQYVTFVKAVPKRTDEPNQIVFNPSLLPAA